MNQFVIRSSSTIHLMTTTALRTGAAARSASARTTAPHAATSRPPRPLTAADLGLPERPRTAGRRDGLTANARATVDNQLRVLLREQLTAGDADQPESVHQMRVAGRRLRVALRMDAAGIGPSADHLRAELSWLGSLLGPVRDLDVLCEHLTTEAADLPEADLPGFSEVLTALLAERSAASTRMAGALSQRRYRALLRALAVEALTPAEVDSEQSDAWTPADLIRRPLRKVHKDLAAAARAPEDVEWHVLRIRVKRTRYAAEQAAALSAPKRRGPLQDIAQEAKRLQDILGDYQDAVAAEHHLRQLADLRTADLSVEALVVLGRLIERQACHQIERLAGLPAACGELYRLSAASI
jgi:CHAD domain-containing protein